MQSEVQSKYTPIEKVRELKNILESKDGLTKENLGLDNENRPYLYKVKEEDSKITISKFNTLIKDCFRKKFLQTNEFHNLQIKDSLDKEIELIKFENFDELWEKLTTESDKKNESDFYISKKILSEKIEKNSNTFYKAKFNRSLNTHFKKDLDDETAGKIAIISDCIAKQYQVDGIKFKSRIEFVSLFHKSRESFDYLKEKNIDIFGGTRNIFLPFDYEFFDTRIQKNNFVNILVCYRNFNFLNFGVKEKNIITIDETIKDDRDLYTEAEATVNRFLKNSSII